MENMLSVVMPAFNEENTIEKILEKVLSVELKGGLNLEIIIVDDASTDSTKVKIEQFIALSQIDNIRYFKFSENCGKGAALRKGIAEAKGKYTIIQDADLEYDPSEYNLLLQPFLDGHADVVYGSRFMGGNAHRILFFWHSIGNKFLTFLSNMLTNLNLTDMETCYKMFRTELLQSLDLKENRFGFEPEVTAKISKVKGVRVYEVGISYYGRTFEEGKKIGWKDGVRALYCIIKYNLFQ
jgi:glycosyltransferase involved in cell wall biosynthesis